MHELNAVKKETVHSDHVAGEPELDCWVKRIFPEEMTLEVWCIIQEGILGSVWEEMSV